MFFRRSIKEEAERLNLTGWVQNLEDGRVEVFAQGAPIDLDALEGYLHQGPEKAIVDGVKTHEEEPNPKVGEFKIFYS